MEKSDQILAAIEHLARSLSGQIEAVRADLKADIARLEGDIARLDGDIGLLKIDVAVLRDGQARILDHLDIAELKGRVEEQSRTIASLIPNRIAAIPGR
jgi:hypothetical protein